MADFDESAMLNPKAAKELCGLAVATLAKLRCVGGGPVYVKAGRKILYKRGDLLDWLNARRVSNTTEATYNVPQRMTDAA